MLELTGPPERQRRELWRTAKGYTASILKGSR